MLTSRRAEPGQGRPDPLGEDITYHELVENRNSGRRACRDVRCRTDSVVATLARHHRRPGPAAVRMRRLGAIEVMLKHRLLTRGEPFLAHPAQVRRRDKHHRGTGPHPAIIEIRADLRPCGDHVRGGDLPNQIHPPPPSTHQPLTARLTPATH